MRCPTGEGILQKLFVNVLNFRKDIPSILALCYNKTITKAFTVPRRGAEDREGRGALPPGGGAGKKARTGAAAANQLNRVGLRGIPLNTFLRNVLSSLEAGRAPR